MMKIVNQNNKSFEYENLASLILGAWLIAVPFIGGIIPTYRGAHVYWWNFILVGLTVIFMSVMALKNMVAWAERVNIIAGIWLMVSPLFLIYFNQSSFYFWNAVLTGGLIAFLAALALPAADHVIYHKHVRTKDEDEEDSIHVFRQKHGPRHSV